MPSEQQQRETDLVLPLGTHAFVLDTTKGNVNVYVGPLKAPLSAQQEQPVKYNASTGSFDSVTLANAVQKNVVVAKGQYVVLTNPAENNIFPKLATSTTPQPDALRLGEVVNLQGPLSFPLWPMQKAEVRDGHQLKSNEYLVVRVNDEDAARRNWATATMKLAPATPPQTPTDKAEGDKSPDSGPTTLNVVSIDPNTLVMGQLLIIKGTEVSFYIPPTGIEVLKGEGGKYVRDAQTLERLEYCLLVDEGGDKRYVIGPEVVFPSPTETFKLNDDGERKSRAYELNEITGLHVKVIAAYEDAYGVKHSEGEELFITGKRSGTANEEETQIYFPRIEHAILKYDGRTRYHAVSIPAGEARYVLNRLTGQIRLERGPSMFLPDPRKEVIVRRVLSPGECTTYFPGNDAVLQYNKRLRDMSQAEKNQAALSNLPGYRSGHVSNAVMASLADAEDTISYTISSSAPVVASRAMDVIERGTKFTPPRQLTLDTDMDGAVKIRPWTGYAIKVVDQTGKSRIEIGPKVVFLEFDERLEILALSTGTPKTADKTIKTVYLRVSNNAVSDRFTAKTQDLVDVEVGLKYLVKFDVETGDRWFDIDNYIQNMVDRFRSLVNNKVRSVSVREFYENAATLLRDWILGEKDATGARPGFLFAENGMRVYELDLLGISIKDLEVAKSLVRLQTDNITRELQMDQIHSELELHSAQEQANLSRMKMTHDVQMGKLILDAEFQERESLNDRKEAQDKSNLEKFVLESEREHEEVKQAIEAISLAIRKAENEQLDAEHLAKLERDIRLVVANSDADQKRMLAVSPQLTQALVAMAQTGVLATVSAKLGDLAIVRQLSLGGMFQEMFKGTPVEGVLENLQKLGTGAVIGK